MRKVVWAISVLPFLVPAAAAADRFEFKDGDRVVLIGSTVIEREQRYGYWETALTLIHPDKNITFRNLGWSGDTVWGEARAVFDSPREGYKRLVEHTLAEKPTVIVVGYGTIESFAGEKGLPAFKAQYKNLLDDLAPAKARLVLMSPMSVDRNEWKFGDADQRNREVRLYRDAIEAEAKLRGAPFVDDIGYRYGPASPLMENGMHLTPWGYAHTAHGLMTELRLLWPGPKPVEFKSLGPVRMVQPSLPMFALPPQKDDRSFSGDCALRISGVPTGKYQLKIDGSVVPVTNFQRVSNGLPPEKVWHWPGKLDDKLVFIAAAMGPSLDQVEKLRQTIVAKNELYFHRWRPQNVTYLFLFRKHEQGNNAVEIPKFDPLIAAKEKEIASLRKPVEHVYELVEVKGNEKQ